MQAACLPVSGSSAFSKLRCSSPAERDFEDMSNDGSDRELSPCSNERLSPVTEMCRERLTYSGTKEPLRFGVDSIMSRTTVSPKHDSKLSPNCKDRDSESSVNHSPRSDISTSGTLPQNHKTHSFSVDEILGKSQTSQPLETTTSSSFIASPAHETRWPPGITVSPGFPWLPSSRLSPPPSKYFGISRYDFN